MIIKYSYFQDPVPTDYYIVVAYKPLLAGGYQEVNRVTYAPAHANPANFVITVPTPAVHRVAIYQSDDGIALGVMRLSFVATPSLDGPIIVPPLLIKVGRGKVDSDGQPIDPAIGSTEAPIPSVAGYTLSWVLQRGAGPLKGPNDTDDVTDREYEPRLSGGINVLNGKEFNENEEYWLYFEPAIDSNISDAVEDLTDLLDAHIQNTSNPHSVTKNQVGLSNIPNAISNSYQQDNPNQLATSKAVYDLWQSIDNKILKVGVHNVGSVAGNSDRLVSVTHSLDLVADSYIVVGNLGGYSGNWNNDNDVTYTVFSTVENTFNLGLRNFGGAAANVVFFYMIIKK